MKQLDMDDQMMRKLKKFLKMLKILVRISESVKFNYVDFEGF